MHTHTHTHTRTNTQLHSVHCILSASVCVCLYKAVSPICLVYCLYKSIGSHSCCYFPSCPYLCTYLEIHAYCYCARTYRDNGRRQEGRGEGGGGPAIEYNLMHNYVTNTRHYQTNDSLKPKVMQLTKRSTRDGHLRLL